MWKPSHIACRCRKVCQEKLGNQSKSLDRREKLLSQARDPEYRKNSCPFCGCISMLDQKAMFSAQFQDSQLHGHLAWPQSVHAHDRFRVRDHPGVIAWWLESKCPVRSVGVYHFDFRIPKMGSASTEIRKVTLRKENTGAHHFGSNRFFPSETVTIS